MESRDDYRYMGRALQLARKGLYTTDPNPRVGCVLVRDGTVVGEGWHERAGGPHAEINALRVAGGRSVGATCYVTLEPCCHQGRTPPCTTALIEAGVRRVVASMVDPNPSVAGEGLRALQAVGIATDVGPLAAEAEALNQGFVQRMRRARPWVRCKLGASLDGRTGTAAGQSKWITSAEARRDVQRLRARSSAIVTGIGTVLADDPRLTVRMEELDGANTQAEIRLPLRVIVDSRLRLPHSVRLLQSPGRVLVATALPLTGAESGRFGSDSLDLISLPAAAGDGVDLSALMGYLAELEVNEVLVEAGSLLSGALLQAGLIDELILYLAPRLLGDSARGMFRLAGLERVDQAIGLDIVDVRAVGTDWRVTARPIENDA